MKHSLKIEVICWVQSIFFPGKKMDFKIQKSPTSDMQTFLDFFLNQLYMIWKARIWRLSWNLWPEKKDIVGWSGRSKFSSKKWGKINEIHRKSIKIGAKNGNRVYLNSSRLIAQWFGNITWQTVARETMKFYRKTWSNITFCRRCTQQMTSIFKCVPGNVI